MLRINIIIKVNFKRIMEVKRHLFIQKVFKSKCIRINMTISINLSTIREEEVIGTSKVKVTIDFIRKTSSNLKEMLLVDLVDYLREELN